MCSRRLHVGWLCWEAVSRVFLLLGEFLKKYLCLLGALLIWRLVQRGILFRSPGLERDRFLRVSRFLGRLLFLRFVLPRIGCRRPRLGGHSGAWLCAFCSILACFSEVLSVFALLKIVGGLSVWSKARCCFAESWCP